VVTKTIKSITKFQVDCGSSFRGYDEDILNLCESVFYLVKERVMEQRKCVSSVFPALDLGLHIARMCHNLQRTKKANIFFEQLQSLTSGVVKPKKTNTAEGCLISRFFTCNISISKAAMLVNRIYKQSTLEEPQKSDDFGRLNKMLDEGKRLLDLLLESRSRTPFSLSTILQSLECLKSSVQSLYNFSKDKGGRSKFVLPYETFQSIRLLLEQYEEMLQSEVESTCIPKKLTTKDSSQPHSQLQQQLQKIVDRLLTLSSFVMKLYQHEIQVGIKEMAEER
jgi:hypothetical protein